METDEKIAIACGIFLIFAIFAGIYLSARFGGEECDGFDCYAPAPAVDVTHSAQIFHRVETGS